MYTCRRSEKGEEGGRGWDSLLKVLEQVLCRNGQELVVYGHHLGKTATSHLPVNVGVPDFGRAVLEAAAVNGLLVHTVGIQEVEH